MFADNLQTLLLALPDAAAPTGFASLSNGTGRNRVFVRGICRGDSSESQCGSASLTCSPGPSTSSPAAPPRAAARRGSTTSASSRTPTSTPRRPATASRRMS
ncbi:hypothetical protein ACQ4PT_049460 [Festuca glaucescens]